MGLAVKLQVGYDCDTMQHRIISQAEFQRRGCSTKPKQVVLSERQITRYLQRVMKGRDTDCWLFQSKSKDDYPRFQGYLAHRIAYTIAYGSIPDGMTIDHLCRTKWCQNPAHLEPVTFEENGKRAVA